MYMKTFNKIGTAFICALFAMPLMAQQTYEEMEQLTVNEQVTTVITASEPIRFVDISTDMVVGDQPINNTIRLKPKRAHMRMVRFLPLLPSSPNDTEPNMHCSTRQGFRRLSQTSKSCLKRR